MRVSASTETALVSLVEILITLARSFSTLLSLLLRPVFVSTRLRDSVSPCFYLNNISSVLNLSQGPHETRSFMFHQTRRLSPSLFSLSCDQGREFHLVHVLAAYLSPCLFLTRPLAVLKGAGSIPDVRSICFCPAFVPHSIYIRSSSVFSCLCIGIAPSSHVSVSA